MYLICSFLVAAALALAADDFRIHTIAGDGELAGPIVGTVAEGSSVGSGWAIAFDSRNRLYISTIAGDVWRINVDGQMGMAVEGQGRSTAVWTDRRFAGTSFCKRSSFPPGQSH